jgi:L-amino acid N-acyltransferase YncA
MDAAGGAAYTASSEASDIPFDDWNCMPTSIELAAPRDYPEIAAIYRPAVTAAATSFELEPPDTAEMGARVEATLVRTPWIVCRSAGETLGYAYATRHRERSAYQWSVEVSAYVRGDMHRHGIGRALYTSLFAVLALQGFRSAVAGITLPNDASVGLHEAVGFTRVGIFRNIGYKNGAWHDTQWLQRPIAPHSAEPSPPTALPELLGTPELETALQAGLPLLRRGLEG